MPAADLSNSDARFEYLKSCAHVAVAVSGGSDSAALMHLVADWRERHGAGAPEVSVLTVDHGLRPASAVELDRVAMWARERGLAHVALAWSGKKPDTGIQAAARTARYDLMSAWCVEAGADMLLVAHTIDDQAETLLMRLARGSGLDGLCGIAPVTQWSGTAVSRPLLDVSRSDLRDWLEARGLAWIDDPSNEDTRFERVRVRKAMPDLGMLGITAQGLARSAARLHRARVALEAETDRAMERCVTVDAAGWCALDGPAFATAHAEVRLRVLARCLQAVGGGARAPSASALERVAERLDDADGRARTLAGCRISRRDGVIRIVRETGRMAREPMRLEPGRARVWDARFRVGWQPRADAGTAVECLDVRPLGPEGWAQVCGETARCAADVGRGLVSFWQGDRLVAVPHVGFRSDAIGPEVEFSADFCNFALLRGARVPEAAVDRGLAG